MKNGGLICAVAIFAVMLLLPFLAITLAPADAGMAICMLLFFAVNPALAIFVGIFCGMDFRRRWFFPFLVSLLFLVGTMSFFEAQEPLFLLYALIYFVISCCSAAGCWVCKKIRR